MATIDQDDAGARDERPGRPRTPADDLSLRRQLWSDRHVLLRMAPGLLLAGLLTLAMGEPGSDRIASVWDVIIGAVVATYLLATWVREVRRGAWQRDSAEIASGNRTAHLRRAQAQETAEWIREQRRLVRARRRS